MDTIEEIPSFFVPVEILYPKDGRIDQYDSLIHEIADARNNNCQLTEETKANHAGYYEELKNAMPDDEIRNAIEWRTNDGGRIKVKEVAALACIPLSTVSEEVAGLKIDLKQIYNSTAKCSAYFNSIYEAVSEPKGALQILRNDDHGRLVANAIGLTRELIEVYDWLTIEFPNAYNAAGGSFGNIESVKGPSRTRYRQRECDFSYSDGFFMPILASVQMLIDRDGCTLRWSENPLSFLHQHLERAMKIYRGKIRDMKYDGREVGRDSGSYETAYETFSMLRDTMQ